MNTKLLMTSAAIITGMTGMALSFLPQEILSLLNESPTPTLKLILQLLGALYFGFAMVNWTAKETLLGGIYGRPIVIGNVTHFVIGALALVKGLSLHQNPILWTATGIYAVFAVLFSIVMYSHPKQK